MARKRLTFAITGQNMQHYSYDSLSAVNQCHLCHCCFCFLCLCLPLAAGDISFSGCPWEREMHTASLLARYPTNRFCEFNQIHNFGRVEDKYELIKFWGQEVKGQHHNEIKIMHFSGEWIVIFLRFISSAILTMNTAVVCNVRFCHQGIGYVDAPVDRVPDDPGKLHRDL